MLAIGAAAASDTNDNLTADKQDSLSLNVDKNVVSNKNLDVLKAKDNESTLRASGSFSDLEQYKLFLSQTCPTSLCWLDNTC